MERRHRRGSAKAQVQSVSLLYEDLPSDLGRPKKRAKYSVPLSLQQSNSFQQVKAPLLELPYRGVMSQADANTYFTQPDDKLRALYKNLKRQAEKEAGDKLQAEIVNPSLEPRKESQYSQNKLRAIHFDRFEIDIWYQSPYPLICSQNPIMFICPHCLSHYHSSFILQRHLLKCSFKRHPAGQEIYRDTKEKVSVFEVDGRKNIIFCQNLCLMAKLFLNSKTLYYDVEPFIFYVMFDFSQGGEFKFIGYFSKEKLNSTGYNLSCIMTLPIYQRRGFGTFLIDFSYLLSRREFKLGTPEKPFSHLGLLSYRNYWKNQIIKSMAHLLSQPELMNLDQLKLTIDDLSNLTGMCYDDVLVGIEQLDALVLKPSVDEPSKYEYSLIFNKEEILTLASHFDKKKGIKIKPEKLIWKPVILGPSGGINTNTTMVFIDDENEDKLEGSSSGGYKPIQGIEGIMSFLNDDLDDDRDMEDQRLSMIIETNVHANTQSADELLVTPTDGQSIRKLSTRSSKSGGMKDELNTPPPDLQSFVCYPELKQVLKSSGNNIKIVAVNLPEKTPDPIKDELSVIDGHQQNQEKNAQLSDNYKSESEEFHDALNGEKVDELENDDADDDEEDGNDDDNDDDDDDESVILDDDDDDDDQDDDEEEEPDDDPLDSDQ